MSSSRLRDLILGIGLDGMDQVRELYSILTMKLLALLLAVIG
jgi:hypothetical protein